MAAVLLRQVPAPLVDETTPARGAPMLTDLAKLYTAALAVMFFAQCFGACLALVFDRIVEARRGR